MSDSDHFKDLLHGMDASLSGKQLQEKNDRVWEDNVVKMILKHFGLDAVKPALADAGSREFGSRYLRLASFMEMYPSFPITLAFVRTKKMNEKVNLSSLFHNFVNLPFMDTYGELLDSLSPEDAASKAVGLLIPWRNTPGGMVLHNCSIDLDTSGVRMLWVHRNKKRKVVQRLVLEPLTSLLRTVEQWIPDEER